MQIGDIIRLQGGGIKKYRKPCGTIFEGVLLAFDDRYLLVCCTNGDIWRVGKWRIIK